MQRQDSPINSQKSSQFVSRRLILKTALAGTAVALPAFAAGTSSAMAPEPLTDRELADVLVAQLTEVLSRMHPNAKKAGHRIESRQDGSFRFWMSGEAIFGEYTGPGFYELSLDGYLAPHWVERDDRFSTSGKLIEQRYLTVQYYEGKPCDRGFYCCAPNIFRKLGEVPA